MYVPGWVDKPDEVLVALDELHKDKQPICFAATPAYESTDDAPTDIFMWEYFPDWVNPNQGSVGSCVGFGTTMAVEATEASEIKVKKDPETFTRYNREVTYGGSRVEIGGGTIRGDGSVGVWAAKFVTKWGVVPLGVYGSYDLTKYDERRCRDFGRNGVPSELETVAKKFPVAAYTQVSTFEEAWKAIGNLNAIAVSSDVGFETERDSNGVRRPRGTWNHCMAFMGRSSINGKRHLFCMNSWDERDIGPVGYGNHPTGGWWVTEEAANRMLSQGDSWAFSGALGFPKKTINWSDM